MDWEKDRKVFADFDHFSLGDEIPGKQIGKYVNELLKRIDRQNE